MIDTPTADINTKVLPKASVKIIAALIKLLFEIGNLEGKRGNTFDVNAMPGLRLDFQNLASRYDPTNLGGLVAATFDKYIKGLCGFRGGARKSDYYYELFPAFTPKFLTEKSRD